MKDIKKGLNGHKINSKIAVICSLSYVGDE